MRLLTLLLFFVLLNCSDSKDKFEKYNLLERKGMLAFQEQNFETALSYFEKAIVLKPTENVTNYFYAASSALHNNEIKKAKKFIISSIQNTNASKEYFLNFDKFDSFRNNKLFFDIENDYENYISEFYDNLNHPEIYKEVDSLVELDQEARNNPMMRERMSEIDSSNIKRLIEITKEYGWQKKGWLILWHQRGTYNKKNYVWDFFKPYINRQIAEGNVEKNFWVMFEEEQSITKNKEQIYGMYTSQYEMFPIIDIENVDKRRAKFGLPPLWYMEKIYNVVLPEEYVNSKQYNQQINY